MKITATIVSILTAGTLTVAGATLLDREPSPPSVEVESVNPGATVERELCLRAAVGSAASAECGDLRISHALPTTTTYNKARTPVLSYSTHQAHPYPVVRADVTLPVNAEVPDSVTVALTLDGESSPRVKETWDGAEWSPGDTRRTVVGFDALDLATGLHDYTLDVVNHYGPVEETTQVTTEQLSIVNRKDSPFGAGWWLLGLEELVSVDSITKLWVGGDGSTRVYTKSGTNWIGVNRSRPDTIQEVGSEFHRLLPGKIKVVFNNNGKHIKTIPRISAQETDFVYNGNGHLAQIQLPAPSGTTRPAYTFSFVGSFPVDQAFAPNVDGASRITDFTIDGNGQLDSLQDPDTTAVSFSYDTEFANRIVQRTDRTGTPTDYRFNRLQQVSGSNVDPGFSQAVIDLSIEHGETQSLDHLAPLSSAIETVIDGPRTDVSDSTRFVLNGFGAPEKITDAKSNITTLSRDSVALPALVTEVEDPLGRTTLAEYNARGNVTKMTADGVTELAPKSITTIEYNETNFPDFPTRIVQPEGEEVIIDYDNTTGNRISQRDGRVSSQVNFRYYASGNGEGLLKATDGPLSPPDTVIYDTLGNVDEVRSPLGTTAEFTRDAIGRLTATRSEVIANYDSMTMGTKVDSTVYDLRDRVTEQRTNGPAVVFSLEGRSGGETEGADEVVVTNTYDDEGRVLSTQTQVTGHSNAGHAVTFAYDSVGRVRTRDSHGQPQIMIYDPASNVTEHVTDRGTLVQRDTLRMTYDELNRLVSRTVPERTFSQEICPGGLEEPVNCDQNQDFVFPFFPNDGGTGLEIDSDTETFTYDEVGNLLTATNHDAIVEREYNLNGTLEKETLKLREFHLGPQETDPFDDHIFVTSYTYDRNARVEEITYPSQVTGDASVENTVTYTYDSSTGLLDTVDGLVSGTSDIFNYDYDDENRLTQLLYPGSITETRRYDGDSRLIRRIKTGTLAGTLQNDSLSYDPAGRMNKIFTGIGLTPRIVNYYAGLGALAGFEDLNENTFQRFEVDGLGNVTRRELPDQDVGEDSFSPVFDRAYEGGRVVSDSVRPTPDTGTPDPSGPFPNELLREFDAGDMTFEEQVKKLTTGTFPLGHPDREKVVERTQARNYYGADGKLRFAQRYLQIDPTGNENFDEDGVFEQYFYDALGRRVMVRSRKDNLDLCDEPPASSCRSYTQRTVWSGDQALVEFRGDGVGSTPSASLDQLTTSGDQWGQIVYTYGAGLDNPLEIIRNDTIVLIPHTDFRGQYFASTDLQGNRHCDTGIFCPDIKWPSAETGPYFDRENNKVTHGTVWPGSVVLNFEDQTGLQYKRNRYYDPLAGQFTQEDPIGLAGGLNLYGFAGGDPVNLSDPFGLMPCSFSSFLGQRTSTGATARAILCHFIRNSFQSEAPTLERAGRSDQFEEQKGPFNAFHTLGPEGAGNRKFVGNDGSEFIFRPDGTLDMTPLNGGTFNFGQNRLTHAVLDVAPFILLGNSPDDPSTFGDRVGTLLTAVGEFLGARETNCVQNLDSVICSLR